MKQQKENETLLFEYGVEGGGASVFRLPDQTIVERGSSGGMLDDDEDPYRTWETPYGSWDAWWQHFTSYKQWFMFSPIFLHPSIRESYTHSRERASAADKNNVR